MAGPIHYEVYLRKTAPDSWSLQMATEDRTQAIQTAEDLLKDKCAVAVRVTKETLDPESQEYSSVTLMTKGVPEMRGRRPAEQKEPPPRCNGPHDLYNPIAREVLTETLEVWLNREGVTAYELLHSPRLAERLDATGVELQHAIQKVAVPQSQITAETVHELMRHYQRLADQTIERLISAGRRDLFPELEPNALAEFARRLTGVADRDFIVGGVITGALSGLKGARARLDRLMDFADSAPTEGPPRTLVMSAIEQLLCEMMARRTNLTDVLGPALDQGASLAAVVRMVAPRELDALAAHDAKIALQIPVVDGSAARLGKHLAAGAFPHLSAALARLVVRELMSPRRLRPNDAQGEIDIMRALAMGLTASADRLLTLEEVQAAFCERSKNLVTADFVAAFVKGCSTALCEAEQLTRLCENVTGLANKRAAARWLSACLRSLRFEGEMRAPEVSGAQRLAVLGRLQRSVRGAALSERDTEVLSEIIGNVGSAIEVESKVLSKIARAPVPLQHKLSLLLHVAAGETAPFGPATERGKAEVLRLLRAPDSRATLAADPAALAPLRHLMKAAGLAA